MEQLVEGNFNLLLAASAATTLLAVLASVAYRALKGRQYPAVLEHETRFAEKWASGTSHKNLLTRLGGARNCLSVTLSGSALIVRPLFPFNLMFLPEVYDLEHFIPRNKIRRVGPSGSGPGGVLIEFETDGGGKVMELVLRKREEFLRALQTHPAHGI